jgi:hypothetical protein
MFGTSVPLQQESLTGTSQAPRDGSQSPPACTKIHQDSVGTMHGVLAAIVALRRMLVLNRRAHRAHQKRTQCLAEFRLAEIALIAPTYGSILCALHTLAKHCAYLANCLSKLRTLGKTCKLSLLSLPITFLEHALSSNKTFPAPTTSQFYFNYDAMDDAIGYKFVW